jgi:hypothetical protein
LAEFRKAIESKRAEFEKTGRLETEFIATTEEFFCALEIQSEFCRTLKAPMIWAHDRSTWNV